MNTITLNNAHLKCEVLPECGGKIRSLVDRSSGKEWMWSNPALPQALPEYGQNFESGLDTGGWDEIFPSVVPSEHDGIMVPDHGDLVSLPWEVLEQEDGLLSMQATARSVPATMRRAIRLDDTGPTLLLDYTLTNNSGQDLPFLVATHPLLAMEPGSRLELAAGTAFHVAGVLGDAPEAESIGVDALNALLAEEGRAWAMKLFSTPGELSEVGFRAADGAVLRMSWDARLLPVLGLWVNHGGWSGAGGAPYRNIGVEPGNATCDALSEAVAAGTAGCLAPAEVRHWTIRVELS